jgi:oxygen-dependent protoporphyrinogen oxidase
MTGTTTPIAGTAPNSTMPTTKTTTTLLLLLFFGLIDVASAFVFPASTSIVVPPASAAAIPAGRTGRGRVGAVVVDASSPRRSSSSTHSSTPPHAKSTTATIDDRDEDRVYDCLVVGGGISGSTLAHNLHRNHGLDVLLCESRTYLGGNVISTKVMDDDGTFVYEKGPNSFATSASIVRISHELGIQDQLVFANESLPPWVNHGGKLHPLPKGNGGKGPKGQLELLFGPNGIVKFALAGDLLTWPGKVRAGIGAFLGHAPPPPSSSASSSDGEGGRKEETIKEWVIRILGDEVFYRIIDPFVSGVYAGDPETLSMRAALPKIFRIESKSYDIPWNVFGALFYGGLARQVELTRERKAYPPDPSWVEFEYGNPGSYRSGLSTLPNAIMDELMPGGNARLGWTLTSISRGYNDDGYVATFDVNGGGDRATRTVRARTVVTTLPAHAIGDSLDPILPGSSDLFDRVRENIRRRGVYYPPVAAVTLAFPKSSFRDVELPNGFGKLRDLPGFGMLNPRSEGVRTLGTLWSSSLFPGRCPPEYNVLLNYIGGSRDPAIGTMSEDEIVDAVDKDLRRTLLNPDACAPKVLGTQVWPTAIPQYELGHLDLMSELGRMEDANASGGLWVCGNYRTGVAFPDCVNFGYDQANVVARHLAEKGGDRTTAAPPSARKALVENAQETAATPLPFFVSR